MLVILFPSLCYNNFFDDYKIFAILLSQLLVIHEYKVEQSRAHVFEAEVFSYELLKFQKNSLKPEGEKLKRA